MNTIQTSLRLPAELHKQLSEYKDQNGISLHAAIVNILTEHFTTRQDHINAIAKAIYGFTQSLRNDN